MRQVHLGPADLEVSAVGFSTWAFGGDWGVVDLEESRTTIHCALEPGANILETARDYGIDAAERLLGEAHRQRANREDVVIATKGGLRMEGGYLLRDASASWLRKGAESSLAQPRDRLHRSVYQVHWPDPRTPAERRCSTNWSVRARSVMSASRSTKP
jgi:aryl-alcohol dehydrogenase-like predicted oxidoreductase